MNAFQMIFKFCLSALILFLTSTIYAQVTSLQDIQPLTIVKGEVLNVKDIVDNVKINDEIAEVSINFSDTSVLCSGHHKIVFTAITFSGFVETFETALNVDNSTVFSDAPQFEGLKDYTISRGKMLDLKLFVGAKNVNNKLIPYFTNITYPEHLSPGDYNIYYTAVDSLGKSNVEKIKLTVNPVEEKIRRIEWARFGKYLYKKYFQPQRYINDVDGVYPYFSYNVPYSTEPGLDIMMFFENVRYDYFSFESAPLKLESLTARLFLLLKELQHNRYLWIDQPQIIISLSEFMPFTIQNSDGKEFDVHKDRGLYGLAIPKMIFMKNDFDSILLDVFDRMKLQTLNEPTRRIRHKMYFDSETGIKILYYQMHSGTLYDIYKDRIIAGEVNNEDDFDNIMLRNDYMQCLEMLKNGDFGRFSNPKVSLFNGDAQ